MVRHLGTACLLPRASASSLGIDEARILALPDTAKERGVRMRSLMVARHGKVGVELFWQPLLPNDLVRTHSVTKSVVAMAAGCLVDDGLLSEDDLVLDLLPEYRALVDDPMGRLGRMRVRHLLSMTSGHLAEPPKQGVDDELLAFLQTPMDAEPGERFFYTSAGVNALSVILERTGDTSLEDLLRKRVLGPIGVTRFSMERCQSGAGKGSGGLALTIEDMCRVGQLLLQGGRWEGRQVIPEAWTRRMGSVEVEVPLMAAPAAWAGLRQGYGLLAWGCPDAGARVLYGLNGQFVVVLDDLDAVIVTAAAEPEAGRVLDLVWDLVVPTLRDGNASSRPPCLPPAMVTTSHGLCPSRHALCPDMVRPLWEEADDTALALPPNHESLVPEGFLRHVYTTSAQEEARTGIARLVLSWDGRDASLSFDESGIMGAITLGTSDSPRRSTLVTMWGDFDVIAAAAWTDERTLEVWLQIVGSEYWQLVTIGPSGLERHVSFQNGPARDGMGPARTYDVTESRQLPVTPRRPVRS